MDVVPNASPDESPYRVRVHAAQNAAGEHVLKHSDTFAVFDAYGDITPGDGERGLYHMGTRHLSRLVLQLEIPEAATRPVLLDASVREDNGLLVSDFTNPDFTDETGRALDQGALHFFRSKLLWDGAWYEHLRIQNYGLEPAEFTVAVTYAADYVDIFEVRGHRRARRGEMLPVEVGADHVELTYRGLDEQTRKTRLAFTPEPDTCTASHVYYRVRLDPGAHKDFYWTVSCQQETTMARTRSYEEAKSERRRTMRERRGAFCTIMTSNEQFNAWLGRSLDDLNLLLTDVPYGYYPYAGIPWYSTVFGRDGLLTALMTLWINPNIARGVLGYLAATQADHVDAASAAEPGKILHETRDGEVPALGEVPFRRYYGTVDATPLFVMLAGAYYQHTGDRAFIERLWPHLERALQWMRVYGDVDDDGFLEYRTEYEGLRNQGWKDSDDAVFHADGRLAEGPIALCEVQGYAYAAQRAAAFLAGELGYDEQASALHDEAKRLQERFEDAFWCKDLCAYALALDGEKRLCRVRASNAGHLLFTGIAREARAEQIVQMLFDEDMYSGWGIRTVSQNEGRYNPMSYHNGSVWPHDNALIGWGLGRYGYRSQASHLLKALFDLSTHMARYRVPELICGFVRRPDEEPTRYPVACAPQAWASAAVFCLLRACLGLTVRVDQKRITLHRPRLPAFIEKIEIHNLKVGQGTIDLALQGYEGSVCIDVLRRDTDVEIQKVM